MADRIRLAVESDAEQIAEIYSHYVVDSCISFEESPPTGDDFLDRMRNVLRAYPWLVYERDGLILGYSYASEHSPRAAYRWSVSTTVYLRSGFHRRGLGRRLYTTLFDLLRLQGFVNAYGGITLPNDGSVGLHESFGFKIVGVYEKVGFKFGVWHDVGWWQFMLSERPECPTEPIPWHELKESPEWLAVLERANLSRE